MALFRKRPLRVPFGSEIFSALFGGTEGGLATTSAIIAGLFVSTYDRELVITTAVISFMVQAFNGAVSRYSGERTTDEIEQIEEVLGKRPALIDALVQLSSHLAGGILVIAPIVLIVNVQLALGLSVAITMILLFLSGAIKAHFVRNDPLVEGLELVVLGAMIISVGIISGTLLR